MITCRHGYSVSARGFTLLELLVALALLGLVSMLLHSAFSAALAHWAKADARYRQMESLLVGRQRLQQLLSVAYPRPLQELELGSGQALDGQPDQLSFVTLAPAALGGQGMVAMTLSVVGKHLELAWRRPGAQLQPAAPLLEASVIEFEYFGQQGKALAPAWSRTWQQSTRLPQLIRIRMRQDSAAAGGMAEWILRPQVDVDVSCLYDPISRDCHGR